MDLFKISEETLLTLDKLSNQNPDSQNIVVDEWCKCTGMD